MLQLAIEMKSKQNKLLSESMPNSIVCKPDDGMHACCALLNNYVCMSSSHALPVANVQKAMDMVNALMQKLSKVCVCVYIYIYTTPFICPPYTLNFNDRLI
jgi:hypothetical protein